MLTIFTTTKPFTGLNKIIQINAIRSWLLLRPECEIIIFGDEEGTAEAAAELGVKHVPDIECNEYGTPLVSSLFSSAQHNASYSTLCYINADIILLSDFLPAIQNIDKHKFLMVGQRWDLDIDKLLEFDGSEWESRLRTKVKENGILHPKSGIDYFVYSKGLYDDMLPFAIGRTAWDNWLIFRARQLKAAVIDATEAVTIIHQNHDYSHNTGGAAAVWKGPEAVKNQELSGRGEHILTLEHATWILTSQGLKRALSPRYLFFQLDAVTRLVSYLRFLRGAMKALTWLLIKIRSALGIT
ncbi:hypothetical protein ACFLYN_01700 [Chloroflexota bacterium]